MYMYSIRMRKLWYYHRLDYISFIRYDETRCGGTVIARWNWVRRAVNSKPAPLHNLFLFLLENENVQSVAK